MQRFDLMAIPAAIIAERRSSAGQKIVDIRLVDGSKDIRSKCYRACYATMPITLFFKNAAAFTSFKEHVGRSPFLFMCLAGNVEKDCSVKFSTLKEMSWWELASGTKRDSMAAQAEELCPSRGALQHKYPIRIRCPTSDFWATAGH